MLLTYTIPLKKKKENNKTELIWKIHDTDEGKGHMSNQWGSEDKQTWSFGRGQVVKMLADRYISMKYWVFYKNTQAALIPSPSFAPEQTASSSSHHYHVSTSLLLIIYAFTSAFFI